MSSADFHVGCDDLKARVRAGFTRAGLVGLIVAAAVLVGGWLAGAASAATRIDMKVLLLGTSTTEPDFMAWQAALQREGVPFDTIIASSGHTPITSSTLSATLSDGTQEGKYQAVIVSVGGLPICTTTCVSGLAQSEWNALEEYEQTFSVRQLTGDVFPGAPYGLNSATTSGALDGTAGALTTDGKAIFAYLNGPVAMDTGTFGYEATPISTSNFDALVSGPGGSALVGIYTHPDGVQEMVETYDQNAYQLQSQLLRHGALEWVTRGVYLGDQRNYLEAHVDDNFLADASWSVSGNATTAPHTTDFNDADGLREVPADVIAAANWSKANNFRIDMLFNGGGSVAVASGDTLVGAGDSGSGATGSSGASGGTASGVDPLLAEFTATDPSTGKPYTGDFGWISHSWDHPNVDEGCATQDYIEAEINQNAAWATTAAGTTAGDPINGGLGLTSSTDPTQASGTVDPQVIITGEHSGLANLLPGNPGQVDPPSLDEVVPASTGGTLPAGQYVYAVTDQFNTAVPGQSPVVTAGQSAASISSPVQVTAPGSVTMTWGSVCHAGQYDVYRAPYTAGSGSSAGTIGAWSLIGKVAANTSTDFINPTGNSTTNTAGGGAAAKTFTDTGTAGTATGSSGTPTASSIPSTEGASDESAYEQNPVLDAAFAASTGGGIKFFGADASKPYPNPSDGAFATGSPPATQYPNGQTFTDAGAQGIPRYPTNIYYNVSTNAQEIDEYQTLYDSPTCVPVTGVTTCNPAGTTFTIGQIVASADQGMFQHMMGNDPRPHYFHQTNLMSQTTGTANGVGDGLFYETMNPLLAEYHQYFNSNAPIEQLTMAQIGALLAEQANWATNANVSGYIEGDTVTITNANSTASTIPMSGVPTVGSAYGGLTSGWTSAPAGTSTYTSSTTWPTAGIQVSQAPQGSWVNTFGSGGYLLAGWDGAQSVSDLPNVSATVSQGTPTQWAQNTTDVRALQAPDRSSVRNAAAYTNPTAVTVKLGFTSAYAGTVSVYALDWNNEGDQESISVDDGSGPRSVTLTSFNNGDWVSVPVNVTAGGTVTVTATKTAGTNAEISGIMLGGAGAPPATGGQQLSQGGWVGGVGSAGYDLAAFNGSSDLTSIPSATVSLVHGSRYVWAANTTDARALSDPNQSTRNAATYYDPNQIEVQLTFSQAYTGPLNLYSVDWDSTARRELITVDGQTDSLASDFSQGAWVSFPITVAANGIVTITVDRTAGANAVLSGIFLGAAGAPPAAPPTATQSPQGSWVGTYGVSGYVLGGWDNGLDSSSLPGVTETVTQGSRYEWAANTTDVRALANAAGTVRDAAAYYDPNQISMQLSFNNAYNGNLELYAVDWDNQGRQETATVNGMTASMGSSFVNGAWLTFPIVVAANGTVTITVDRTAGPNAVLSGIFIGGAGTPPAGPPIPTQSPQGNWVGTYGAAGYTLAGWNNGYDLTAMPGVTETLAQGSTYQWAANTTDVRALANSAGTVRNAATYYDPNQIVVQLTFSVAYQGNLHLYAVDWDTLGRRETITVNGVTANLSSDFSHGAWVSFPINVAANSGITITVARTAGLNAVLSGIFLGDAGTPPAGPITPTQSPQGNWVGTHGAAGYDLAAFNGGSDVISGSTATASLIQGSRYVWTANQPISTDTQALADPTGAFRTAATYYDPNQISIQLTFPNTFTGNLELYAVDWDSTARRETITVGNQTANLFSDFSQGAWITFPISVAAGGKITITINHVAGANAVLSGIFLN